jgi:hypothetical protein
MRHAAPLAASLLLSAAATGRAVTITTVDQAGDVGEGSAVAHGPNGFAMVSYVDVTNRDLKVAACQNAACTSSIVTTLDSAATVRGGTGIAFGSDGLAVISYRDEATSSVKLAHCSDAACTSATISTVEAVTGLRPGTAVAVGSDGLPVVAYGDTSGSALKLAHCSNPTCSAASVTPFAGRVGANPSLAVGGDGRVVVACDDGLSAAARLHLGRCTDVACTAATFLTLVPEFVGFQRGHSRPSLATRTDGLVAFAYQLEAAAPPFTTYFTTRTVRCADASCAAIQDIPGGPGGNLYDPALGFLPGERPLVLHYNTTPNQPRLGVTRCPDVSCLPAPLLVLDETEAGTQPSVAVDPAGIGFVAYYTAAGRDLKVAHLSGGDLTIGDATTLEGHAGTTEVVLPVRVSAVGDATVQYATVGASATSAVDFVPASGILTFDPGVLEQTVRVQVIGDLGVENNEIFFVRLSNPDGALIARIQGGVSIVDDDVAATGIEAELAHGARMRGDLAASGAAANVDHFRLLQAPHASYEIVVDEVSGDLTPLQVTRTNADGTTVVQTATPVAVGPSVSMRWRNFGVTVGTQMVRVASGGCGTDCGADDVYRIRAYETTLRGARFNKSGGQTTVVLLQNVGDSAIDLTVNYWSEAGVLLHQASLFPPLPPQAVASVTGDAIPALIGKSGSLTVSHTGRHGSLVGKAVSLEPATGFAFDTPLTPRP